MFRRRVSLLLGLAAFLLPLLVYSLTLCPTVSFVDAGELAVSSYQLGIAHPTGYPLYVLLGRLFSLIPLGTVVQRTNFMSALFASASAFFLYLTIFTLLNRYDNRQNRNRILALFCSASFAFSTTIWNNAVITEVYSLTALLASVLLFLAFSKARAALPLFAYVLGLSLTNHISVLLVGVPCSVYLMATSRGFMRKLPFMILFFLVGLSAYIYLPTRAAQAPLMNWGNPCSLQRFVWHVTGKQYRVWMFNLDQAVLKANFVHFLRLASDQYTPFLLWVPVLGILSARRSRPLIVVIAVIFLDLLYSLNYDIPDIDAYYIPAFMMMAVASAFGLRFIFAKARRLSLVFLAALVPLAPLTAHYHKCDMSRNRIAYEYAENFLKSVESGGLCLTNNWDIYSPALYIQYIEQRRQDVVLIDKELLRRSWYFDFLANRYPATYAKTLPEIGSYLEELHSFEHGRLESSTEIQMRFIRMLNALIVNQMRRGPAYTTFADGRDVDAPQMGKGLNKVPHGLVYEFSPTDEYKPFDWKNLLLESSFETETYKDPRTRSNLAVYPRMMLLSGIGLLSQGQYEHARVAFQETLRLDSENLTAMVYLGVSYLMPGQYSLAEDTFQRVMAKDPGNALALEGLNAARAHLAPPLQPPPLDLDR